MKTSRKFTFGLAGTLILATFGTAALAAGSTECGLIGSWAGGDAGGDLVWVAAHTPGTHSKSGEMVLNWVVNNMVPPPLRMTPGHGVWEETRKGQYDYTWYAFMVDDASGQMLRVVVHGTAVNYDCNRVDIRYRFRAYDGDLLVYETPSATREPGYASEQRLPIVKQ